MGKKVFIVGIGMGNPDTLTVQANKVIAEADAFIGAKRMIEGLCNRNEDVNCYYEIMPSEIVARCKEVFNEAAGDCRVVALMSGDVGFYSGAKKLASQLEDEKIDFELIPGISSLQYMASKVALPWDEMSVVSLHGRKANPLGSIYSNRYTFLLLGSDAKPNDVCSMLADVNLGELKVYIGEKLSYEDEKIVAGRALDFADDTNFSGLAVMIVENPGYRTEDRATHGLPDETFIRGKVPMTKEEVRTIAVSKLNLKKDDVVYDVGAGTGSIACEIALRLSGGRVFAIEHNVEGVELIRTNKNNLGLQNLTVVSGRAPEALVELPAADSVFIGGSGGEMAGIVKTALDKNPDVRIVITAIAINTLSKAMDVLEKAGMANIDVVEIFAARTRDVGPYKMMDGMNPVFIISAGGRHE